MKTKQVLSLAASARTKGSSNLMGKSHFCFHDFYLSKGLGCFGFFVWFWHLFGFWFSFSRKFQLLYCVFHLEAPTTFCTALVFFHLNLSLCLMPLPRSHQLQALSSFCYFSIPCSGDPLIHATCYAVPLLGPSITFSRFPLATFKLKILND